MDDDERLWHVRVAVGGPARTLDEVADAMGAFAERRPFLHSLRHGTDAAEFSWWEEADSMLDAAALSIRVWPEHRDALGLGDWVMTGFAVTRRPEHGSPPRLTDHVDIGLRGLWD